MICLSEKYKPGRLLEVSGRSMEPTLWDGQIVEVMEGYQDGDIVVAEHEERLIVKRLVGDKLLGDNLVLSTDFFVADVCILGRAEVRTKEELEERGAQVDRLSVEKVYAAWEPWIPSLEFKVTNFYTHEDIVFRNGKIEKREMNWQKEKDDYVEVSSRILDTYDFSKCRYRVTNTCPYDIYVDLREASSGILYPNGSKIISKPNNNEVIRISRQIDSDVVRYHSIKIEKEPFKVTSAGWELVDEFITERKFYFEPSKYNYRILNKARDGLGCTVDGALYLELRYNESRELFLSEGSHRLETSNTNYALRLERQKLNSNPTLTLSTQNNIVLSQGTVTLSGNAIDPDRDTMTISATIAGIKKQTTVAGTGSWSLSWPVADLPQGQYSNVVVTATDGNGGTATVTYTRTITIDKTKPTISVSGVAEGQTYISVTPTFSATDTGGSGLQSCTATLNGNAFTSGTQITVGGSYTLVVTAKDNAGNISTQTINFKVNSAPTVEVTTANNQTLYEGDSLIISGSANDVNVGNALIVKLRFDEEPEKNILVTTSTGTPQPISYTVTFKNNRLYDMAGNPITPELNKDVVHSFTVYAKDDSGAESLRIVRQFMVVPNRNPLISVNPLQPLSGMVPTDTFSISGTVNDPDAGNTVTMEYKLNQGPFQLATMEGETWSFSISVGDLRDGENIVELKALDNKGGVTVKRMAIDQTPRIVPVKVSQSRYMILPPKGEMKGLVAWIQRKKGDLQVKGDLSIVAPGQPESFVPMEKTSAELSQAIDEDQFIGSVETAGQNVTIKLTETRTDALNLSAAITKIAGVIN